MACPLVGGVRGPKEITHRIYSRRWVADCKVNARRPCLAGRTASVPPDCQSLRENAITAVRESPVVVMRARWVGDQVISFKEIPVCPDLQRVIRVRDLATRTKPTTRANSEPRGAPLIGQRAARRRRGVTVEIAIPWRMTCSETLFVVQTLLLAVLRAASRRRRFVG